MSDPVPQPLNARTLAYWRERVPAPAYDRDLVTPGVVHFGVGGFHRAHQAMYLDRLMNQGQALDWGICGVGVMPADRKMKEVLEAQDGLYTLVLKHSDGTYEPRVIGSIVEYLFAPDDPEAVIEKMAARRSGSCRSPSPRAGTTSATSPASSTRRIRTWSVI
jgi:mannitol 2-dehydrogenase